jgi:hypothetical protein
MTEQGTTRFVAFYTIALGAAFTALPTAMSRFFGMGHRPWLAQYFGVRDLVLGGALPDTRHPGPRLLGCGLADASDAGILTWGLLTRRFGGHAVPLLAAALGSCALSVDLAGKWDGR